MKVLTFTSLFPNAVQPVLGVFVYQRVVHFARRPGNFVDVVAPVPYSPRWLRWGKWQKYGQVPRQEAMGELTVVHPRYPLLPKVAMPFHGLLMFLGCLRSVLQLRKANRFDCFDAHFIYPDGFAAVLLGKLLRVPVICSARGTDINLYPAFSLIRPMIRWTLREAAGLIAVSRSLKDTMVRLGAPAGKVQVIGNGVDAVRFEPLDRTAARRRLGLPESGPLLVSVAALLPHKGHQLLISALAEVVPQHPGLKLYIIGEGNFRPELERLIRDRQLAGRVFLVGIRPNEELKLWYNAADMSCLGSSREGWPNVLLESIACGTPVVATRVGGVPEVLVSPELGIMVEPNTRSVVEGLELALQKQWNRTALVEYAQARTWEVVASEVEEFFAARLRQAWPSRVAPV